MTRITLYFLCVISFISCNQSERRKHDTQHISKADAYGNNLVDSNPDTNPFIGGEAVDSASLLDTLVKHEFSEHYQTTFIEQGQGHLISRLYQGRVNGHGFGITVNFNNGLITVYSHKNGAWHITDRIDEDDCLDFKSMVKTYLNNDKYLDITLVCPDNYNRVAFLFNPDKKIIEHASRYDRKEL